MRNDGERKPLIWRPNENDSAWCGTCGNWVEGFPVTSAIANSFLPHDKFLSSPSQRFSHLPMPIRLLSKMAGSSETARDIIEEDVHFEGVSF